MSDAPACLITGASGFLAAAIAAKFRTAGYALYGIDVRAPPQDGRWAGFCRARLEDADLTHLMAGRSPAIVCHLAGSSTVGRSVADPNGDFESLLPGTCRLLNWIGKGGPGARLLLFSSAAVYGNPAQLPVMEDCSVAPISPYGIHKAAAELMCHAYAKLYGFRSVALRVFSAYGPGLRKQVIWDIATKALKASADGTNFVHLDGTGRETRDFVYVEDVADAALVLARNGWPEAVQQVNIGSGVEVSIRQLARKIVEILGVKVEVSFSGAARAGDPARWCADISLLRELGGLPRTTLDRGLKGVSTWLEGQVAR